MKGRDRRDLKGRSPRPERRRALVGIGGACTFMDAKWLFLALQKLLAMQCCDTAVTVTNIVAYFYSD